MKGAKAVAGANHKTNWTSLLKLKGKTTAPQIQDDESEYGETGSWGVLKSGLWGNLGSELGHASVPGDEDTDSIKDPSFDFPLVLLDVDDSIPRFKSVVEEKDADAGWVDEAGFYPS